MSRSMLPRRTNELLSVDRVSSVKKQERLSRIAQPTLRQRNSSKERSLNRASSSDSLHGNHVLNPYIASSAVKKRSTSATPLRTPIRSRSRSGCGDNSSVMLTSEKERYPDKKFIHDKVVKIEDYIQKNIFTNNPPFTLKEMTTKQFITIVSYLLKFIAGNRVNPISGANYVDMLPNILLKYGYRYTVNKSWLKTPTAPHAIHFVVTLIDWLLIFAPNQHTDEDNNGHDFDYKYILADENFHDKETTCGAMQKEREAFLLWNNNKVEDYEAMKKTFEDYLILKRTGLEGISALDNEIACLKQNIEEIQCDRKEIKHEKTFIKKDHDIKDKRKYMIDLELEHDEKVEKLKKLEEYIEKQMDTIKEYKNRIQNYENIIKDQQITMEQRNELIIDIDCLKQNLIAKEKSVRQLQDLGSSNQIIYARLLKKLVETIADFNSFVDKIFTGLQNLESIDVKEMILDQNSKKPIITQLNEIVSKFQILKENNLKYIKLYEDELKIVAEELNHLSMNYKNLNAEFLDLNKKYEKLEFDLNEVTQLNSELLEKIGKEINEIKHETNELVRENEQSIKIIEERKIYFIELKIKNHKMLNEIKEKGNKILTEKEKFIRELKESVDSFSKTIEKAESEFNQMKDED